MKWHQHYLHAPDCWKQPLFLYFSWTEPLICNQLSIKLTPPPPGPTVLSCKNLPYASFTFKWIFSSGKIMWPVFMCYQGFIDDSSFLESCRRLSLECNIYIIWIKVNMFFSVRSACGFSPLLLCPCIFISMGVCGRIVLLFSFFPSFFFCLPLTSLVWLLTLYCYLDFH